MSGNFAGLLKKERALEILCQLVRIRTMLPRGDELDMVKYILALFDKDTLDVKIIDHGFNRASMAATLPGVNRSKKIALIGHMDTFPIFDEETWLHPPFAADYVDGRVYGRGAANMKGGITAMVMALQYFTRQKMRPPCDIMLCLTADGDSAALTGARSIADSGYLDGVTEAIFAEATDNKIAIAQRGGIWLKIKAKGKACYACIPGVGCDALQKFIELYNHIDGFVCKDGLTHKYLGRPLCSITQLSGGFAMNVIAPEAVGTLDVRLLPFQDNEDVIQYVRGKAREMTEKNADLSFEIEVVNSNLAVGMAEDAPMILGFSEAIRRSGRIPEKRGLFYFTDACAIIPKIGVPFVLFGPGDDVYNKLRNEYVELDSVLNAASTYINYILMS